MSPSPAPPAPVSSLSQRYCATLAYIRWLRRNGAHFLPEKGHNFAQDIAKPYASGRSEGALGDRAAETLYARALARSGRG